MTTAVTHPYPSLVLVLVRFFFYPWKVGWLPPWSLNKRRISVRLSLDRRFTLRPLGTTITHPYTNVILISFAFSSLKKLDNYVRFEHVEYYAHTGYFTHCNR
jgi:hypothetical protein